MRTTDDSSPDVRRLIGSWLTLTRQILTTLAARAVALVDTANDTVKDAILNLGCEPPEPAEAQLLPPLCPNKFVEALRGPVEEALRQIAALLNEVPGAPWTAAEEERVLALFQGLGREALEQALELRIAAAEEQGAKQQGPHGQWARKYRRMLATEGRWPQNTSEA